jgi:ABC-type hemin transport system ATPase subunit
MNVQGTGQFADRVALMHSGRLEGVGLPTDILHPVTLGSAFDGHVVVDQGPDGHPVVLPLRARRS